jgi:hypothetical protein
MNRWQTSFGALLKIRAMFPRTMKGDPQSHAKTFLGFLGRLNFHSSDDMAARSRSNMPSAPFNHLKVTARFDCVRQE